jgi:hypothetical protein
MNEPIPDEDLQALFARRRSADHERTPGFSAMRSRVLGTAAAAPSLMPLMWRWALSGAAALGLGLATVLSLHHSTKAPPVSRNRLARELEQIDAALQKSLAAQNARTAWQSPTDFLLNPTRNENTP